MYKYMITNLLYSIDMCRKGRGCPPDKYITTKCISQTKRSNRSLLRLSVHCHEHYGNVDISIQNHVNFAQKRYICHAPLISPTDSLWASFVIWYEQHIVICSRYRTPVKCFLSNLIYLAKSLISAIIWRFGTSTSISGSSLIMQCLEGSHYSEQQSTWFMLSTCQTQSYIDENNWLNVLGNAIQHQSPNIFAEILQTEFSNYDVLIIFLWILFLGFAFKINIGEALARPDQAACHYLNQFWPGSPEAIWRY